jgi:hypothetical protein
MIIGQLYDIVGGHKLHAWYQAQWNIFMFESPAQLLKGDIAAAEAFGDASAWPMWGCRHDADTIGASYPCHGDCLLKRAGPVINLRKDMRVHVNHRLFLALISTKAWRRIILFADANKQGEKDAKINIMLI